ncbi:MAG: HEAT repeat domain-containing protein [Planctomycetota bacterium]|nr:HEAT repeat domain-containing protein [Planctomycetota bacterium]
MRKCVTALLLAILALLVCAVIGVVFYVQSAPARGSSTLRSPTPQAPASQDDREMEKRRAAPVVDGFSDPNRIVYDDAFLQNCAKLARARWGVCADGWVQFEVLTDGGLVPFEWDVNDAYLGTRFQAAALMRFLEARVGREHEGTQIEVKIPHATGGKAVLCPWESDICTVLRLVGAAKVRKAASVCVRLLKDKSLSVRWAAARALLGVEPDGAVALPLLIDLLADKEMAHAAQQVLRDYGVVAAPYLAAALQREDLSIRLQAARTLAEIKGTGRDLIPPLLKAMGDPDVNVRACATQAVGRYAVASEEVFRALEAAAQSTDASAAGVRYAALVALRDAGPEGWAVVARALKHPDCELRAAAAFALGQYPPAGAEAFPLLIEALADPDYRVRTNASQSIEAVLKKHSAKQYAVAVAGLLKHERTNGNIAQEGANILWLMGDDAAPALEAIEQAARDHPATRMRVEQLLVRLRK